jgi:hypothetical protein
MRIFLRTLAYSVALCSILGYVTYRVHSSPSQIRLRLEGLLGRILACPPEVEGCEQPFLDLLAIEKVTVPACPPVEERALLQVEGIRVNDPSSRRAFRRILAKDPEVSGRSPMSIHARGAVLLCERSPVGARGGARWNFDDLFIEDGLEKLAARRFQVNVDRLLVEVRDFEGPGRSTPWKFDLGDAEVRGAGPSGLSLEADLAEGEHWAGGRAQAAWLPGEGIVVRGGADDLRSPEAWLPLLGGHCRTFWDVFRIAGEIGVDLEELRLVRGRAPRWQASARHYDSTIRLGRLGAEVRHLSGVMKVTESRVILGEEGAAENPAGELWGMPVSLRGKVEDAAAELTLRVAQVPIEDLSPSSRDPSLRESPVTPLLSGIRPSGKLEGNVTCAFRPGGAGEWSADLRFLDVALGELPGLTAAAGTVALAGAKVGAEDESAPPAGKGVLRLESAMSAGLGMARGQIDLAWDRTGIRATLYDLKVGGAGAAASPPPPESGTVFGTFVWRWDGSLGEVDLRWMGLALDTALIDAAGAAGSIQRPGPGAEGRGRLQVEGARIAAGTLAADVPETVFGPGECSFRLDGDGFEILGLRLSGRDGALRMAGAIGLDGRADLVLFLAVGPAAPVVAALSGESRPPEWKDAAEGNYRAFRVTGSLMKPHVRAIGGLDPVFVGPAPGDPAGPARGPRSPGGA